MLVEIQSNIFNVSDEEIIERSKFLIGHKKERNEIEELSNLVFGNNYSEKEEFLGITGYILLHGNPGVGKTSVCYELAYKSKKKYQASFYSINISNLISEKLGKTAKAITLLFEEILNIAKTYNVVMLIEEIDVFLVDRGSSKELEDMKRALTIFMRYMDNRIDNLMIIATTNHIDKMDKAILRRFSFEYNLDRFSFDDYIEFLTHDNNPFKDNFKEHLKTTKSICEMLVDKNIAIGKLKKIMKKIYIQKKDITGEQLLNSIKEN